MSSPLRMTRLAGAVLGGCLAIASALSLAPPAAAAPPPLVLPVQVSEISAVAPVRVRAEALRLYRSLVPRPYRVPAEPAVALDIAHFDLVDGEFGQATSALPGGLTDWTQGTIALAVSFRGHAGWYPLSVPVDSSIELTADRAAGLPAYLTPPMAFGTSNGTATATATATAGGYVSRYLALHFRPAAQPPITGLDASHATSPAFTRYPALRGPGRRRIVKTPRPLLEWGSTLALLFPAPGLFTLPAAQPGRVAYHLPVQLNPGDATLPALLAGRHSLRDLVPLRGSAPGLLYQAWELLSISTTTLRP